MDLDFIKSKLDTLQGKNKQSAKFWKPSEGESRVRIVPYKFNRENPFIELKFYYYRGADGKTKTFLSPSVNGNPDPVLEFCEDLRATGTKENWVRSKGYEPKLRTYVPVVVRGQEDQGVKFWGFGKQVYEAILEKMSNPDIGDITDLENGNDLIIKFTKTPPSGKKFPETKIDVRIKKTPAVDPTNDDLMNKLTDQVDIMTLFTEPSYEELKKEFAAHVDPENEPEPTVETQAEVEAEASVTAEQEQEPAKEEEKAPEATPDSAPAAEKSPTAEKATVTLSPDEMKAKFKKMFAEAAASK